MSPARRDALILGAVGLGAAAAGGVIGALALQSSSGVAELLSSSFADLSGRTRRVSEFQGRPVLCNFWATWCEPCREELPLLDAAQQREQRNGVQIVGIGIDTAANIREYLKVIKVGYLMLVGEAGAIGLMHQLGNRSGGLPFSVALDRSGRLKERKLGSYSESQLRQELAGLLR